MSSDLLERRFEASQPDLEAKNVKRLILVATGFLGLVISEAMHPWVSQAWNVISNALQTPDRLGF